MVTTLYAYPYGEMQIWLELRRLPPILVFVGQMTQSNVWGGGGGSVISQSTPPPGGRFLPKVHADPAAAGRLLPEAVAPEALATDVHKHRGEQGGGDLG